MLAFSRRRRVAARYRYLQFPGPVNAYCRPGNWMELILLERALSSRIRLIDTAARERERLSHLHCRCQDLVSRGCVARISIRSRDTRCIYVYNVYLYTAERERERSWLLRFHAAVSQQQQMQLYIRRWIAREHVVGLLDWILFMLQLLSRRLLLRQDMIYIYIHVYIYMYTSRTYLSQDI